MTDTQITHAIPTDIAIVPPHVVGGAGEGFVRVWWDEKAGVYRAALAMLVADPVALRFSRPGSKFAGATVPFAADGTLTAEAARAALGTTRDG